MSDVSNKHLETCPLSEEALPPQFRKQVNSQTKKPMRMMAAKGLIPMPPADQVKALFILTYDSDEEVRQAAWESCGDLPDGILAPVLRGDLPPEVLDFMARRLQDKSQYLELILLNPRTPDESFAYLAAVLDGKLLEIIADNQLRLLRHEDIIRGLHSNPAASAALQDKVVDFAVRSGVNIPDLPAFQEARRRILGTAADEDTPREKTAQGLLEDHAAELSEESDGEVGEEKRQTLAQKVLEMTVSEKIKLAALGNKEARTLLLRDSNKLVQSAAVQSPRITEGEIASIANSRTIPDEVLRIVLSNRDWMKSYQIKLNLINNPKTPLPTAIRFLTHLRTNDLRSLARNRNVPSALSTQAKNLMAKKSSGQ